MAIVTDRTITIHGVQVGISKPIMQLISTGDFTYDELSKFAFVGRHDFINDFIGIYESELQETGSASSLLAKNKYPAMNDPSQAWSTIKYLYTGKGERPYDAYGKMVLVYNRTSASSAIQNNYSDSNNACIVTDINPRLLKMIPNITHSTVTATYGEPGTYDIYDAEASISIKWYDDSSTAPFSTLCVQKYDQYQYFTFPLYDNRATSTEVISGNAGGTKARMYYMNDAFNRPGNKYISPWAQTDDIDDFASGASYSSTWNCVNKVNTDRANRNLILKYRGSPNYEGTLYVKAADLDAILKQCAGCGLYFEYNSTIYKPIVEGGIVTGYTDDLMHNSEWDLINDVTGNTIPDSPGGGGGGGDEDDFDDHEMGAGTGISGMANLWLLTKSQLNDLHSAFNSAPGGFDPMNSLISVMGLGVAPIYLFDNIEVITPINIRKSDGTSWSTGVEGHIVDAQKSAFQFTGITVNRKYNNFLDFSPYAIHEIFIPMCGWLTLPDIAVDRSITVTYLPDVESLKCRAVVSVVDNSGHRCIIGEKEGIMGADVPFTNTGHSLYVGEAIINGMNVAGEVITGAIGAGFTKTNAKGGTYRPYEGFTVGMGGTLPGAIGNAIVSGQTNRTHYMTGNGTRIGFSDGENIQIKSTYHNIDKPSNYDHTVGKVCNKTGALSSFHGFTVCDNPHINISALEDEKSEIKSLLEQGVILPSGE